MQAVVVAMPAPVSSELGEAKIAEDQDPRGERIEDHAAKTDPESRERTLHRGDEAAQDDEEEERQQRPFEAAEISAGQRRERRILPKEKQDRFGEPEKDPDRNGYGDRAPHSLTEGAADVAHRMLTLAKLSRDDRRGRHDDADGEDHEGEEQVHAEGARGERLRAEAADQDHVDRGHRGLREIGQHERPGQREQGLGFDTPRPFRRDCW